MKTKNVLNRIIGSAPLCGKLATLVANCGGVFTLFVRSN